jgi:hypothetical protein
MQIRFPWYISSVVGVFFLLILNFLSIPLGLVSLGATLIPVFIISLILASFIVTAFAKDKKFYSVLLFWGISISLVIAFFSNAITLVIIIPLLLASASFLNLFLSANKPPDQSKKFNWKAIIYLVLTIFFFLILLGFLGFSYLTTGNFLGKPGRF